MPKPPAVLSGSSWSSGEESMQVVGMQSGSCCGGGRCQENGKASETAWRVSGGSEAAHDVHWDQKDTRLAKWGERGKAFQATGQVHTSLISSESTCDKCCNKTTVGRIEHVMRGPLNNMVQGGMWQKNFHLTMAFSQAIRGQWDQPVVPTYSRNFLRMSDNLDKNKCTTNK